MAPAAPIGEWEWPSEDGRTHAVLVYEDHLVWRVQGRGADRSEDVQPLAGFFTYGAPDPSVSLSIAGAVRGCILARWAQFAGGLTFRKRSKGGFRYWETGSAEDAWHAWRWEEYDLQADEMRYLGVTARFGVLVWYDHGGGTGHTAHRVTAVQSFESYLRAKEEASHPQSDIPPNILREMEAFEAENPLSGWSSYLPEMQRKVDAFILSTGFRVPKWKHPPPAPDLVEQLLLEEGDWTGFEGEYHYAVKVYESYLLWYTEMDELWVGGRRMRFQWYDEYLRDGPPSLWAANVSAQSLAAVERLVRSRRASAGVRDDRPRVPREAETPAEPTCRAGSGSAGASPSRGPGTPDAAQQELRPPEGL